MAAKIIFVGCLASYPTILSAALASGTGEWRGSDKQQWQVAALAIPLCSRHRHNLHNALPCVRPLRRGVRAPRSVTHASVATSAASIAGYCWLLLQAASWKLQLEAKVFDAVEAEPEKERSQQGQ